MNNPVYSGQMDDGYAQIQLSHVETISGRTYTTMANSMETQQVHTAAQALRNLANTPRNPNHNVANIPDWITPVAQAPPPPPLRAASVHSNSNPVSPTQSERRMLQAMDSIPEVGYSPSSYLQFSDMYSSSDRYSMSTESESDDEPFIFPIFNGYRLIYPQDPEE